MIAIFTAFVSEGPMKDENDVRVCPELFVEEQDLETRLRTTM